MVFNNEIKNVFLKEFNTDFSNAILIGKTSQYFSNSKNNITKFLFKDNGNFYVFKITYDRISLVSKVKSFKQSAEYEKILESLKFDDTLLFYEEDKVLIFLFNGYGKLKNDDFKIYESKLDNKITDDSLLIQIEFFRNTFFLDEKELVL